MVACQDGDTSLAARAEIGTGLCFQSRLPLPTHCTQAESTARGLHG